MKTGIDKINSICKSVMTLTEEDFQDTEETIQEQQGYIHPLKLATQRKYNDLGEHNMKVLKAVRKLQEVIKSGESVVKRKVSKL